jgi:hypothetical protein
MSKLFTLLHDSQCSFGMKLILVIDPILDRLPCTELYRNKKNCLNSLIQNDMKDIWRLLHPNLKEFTFERNASKSRIDLFLISENLIRDVVSTSIDNEKLDDTMTHFGISLCLSIPEKINFKIKPRDNNVIQIDHEQLDAKMQEKYVNQINENPMTTMLFNEASKAHNIHGLNISINKFKDIMIKTAKETLPLIEKNQETVGQKNMRYSRVLLKSWRRINRIIQEFNDSSELSIDNHEWLQKLPQRYLKEIDEREMEINQLQKIKTNISIHQKEKITNV